jgi:hypothetical protein
MAVSNYRVTIAGRDFTLRYSLGQKGTVRAIERAVRGLLEDKRTSFPDCFFRLLGVSDVQAAIVWGGIKDSVTDRELAVEDVMDLLQEHIDQGGDLGRVMRAVRRAVLASGVLGPHSAKEIDDIVPAEKETAAAITPQ